MWPEVKKLLELGLELGFLYKRRVTLSEVKYALKRSVFKTNHNALLAAWSV